MIESSMGRENRIDEKELKKANLEQAISAVRAAIETGNPQGDPQELKRLEDELSSLEEAR